MTKISKTQTIPRGYSDEYEIEFVRKDGTIFPASVRTWLITTKQDEATGKWGIIRDITERKQAEKSIKESEEKLNSILTGIGDYITIQNKNLDIIWANQPVRDNWGDVLGKKCYEVYKGLTTQCSGCTVETVFNDEKTVVSEGFGIHPDGRRIQVLTTSSPIRDTEGNIVAVVEMVKDITERKKLELQLKDYAENLEEIVEERTIALRESEEKLEAILSGIGDLITIQNKNLDIIWANQPMRDLWGDVIGEKCYQVYKGLIGPCPDCTVETVFNDEKTVVSERYSILPNERHIHHLTTSSPVRDADGNIVGVVEVLKDITERTKLELQLKNYTENLEAIVEERTKALRESEERLKAILTGIGDLITIQNKELDIIWANQTLKDLWGDVIGKKCYQVYKGIDTKCPDCYFEKVFNEGKTIVSEHSHILPDGRHIHHLLTSSPVRDVKGNSVAIVEVEKDITERKKLELQLEEYTENLEKMVDKRTTALRESEEKLEAILSGIGDLITIHNRDLDIIWANQPIRDIWGEVLREKCYKVYKGLDAPCPECTVEAVFTEGRTFVTEQSVIKADGNRMNTLVTSAPMKDAKGNIVAVVETVKDITDRKRAEELLKESEEKFRNLAEQSPNMIFINKKGRIVFANKKCEEIMGYTQEELYSQDFDFLSLIHPEHREFIMENFRTHMRGEDIAPYEYCLITKDGKRIDAIITTKLIDYEGDTAILGIITDITERKQAEMALREAEAKYRTLVEQSLQGLIISQDGRIVFANQALAKITGYTVEELLALSPEKVMQIIHPEDQSLVWGRMRDRLQGKSVPNHYEYRGIRKDGSVVWLEMFSNLIEYSGKPAVQAVVADITEKLKIEEEILKMQKLESLGILAGGIAHDFNNILTAILGNISVAKLSVKPGDTVFNRLTEAEKASMRAKDLTQQLLTFSKGGIPIKKTTSLAEVLKDTATFTLSGSSVECKFTIQEDIWPVEVDEGQISQVIHNLIINADQAMPEGGMIEVSAENITIGIEAALPLQEGNYVKILIKDQGIGIPKDHLSKIFDPYFSTKQKGSGLGLTVAYSIIKNHEGYITVDSELGVGTTFPIYLPASKKQILPEKIKEEKPIIGKGKILVMDDEEIIRDALDEILTTLEYQVGFAKNGEEAIALYKQAKEINEPFHAVIMDLTIRGGMGGKEAIKKLLEIDPNVKAIVSSGYSTDPVMADHQKYGFSGVVAKPYDIMELSETLHKVITKKNEK